MDKFGGKFGQNTKFGDSPNLEEPQLNLVKIP